MRCHTIGLAIDNRIARLGSTNANEPLLTDSDSIEYAVALLFSWYFLHALCAWRRIYTCANHDSLARHASVAKHCCLNAKHESAAKHCLGAKHDSLARHDSVARHDIVWAPSMIRSLGMILFGRQA